MRAESIIKKPVKMYSRFLLDKITASLDFSPVTYLCGPRQSGKSTLSETMNHVSRNFISMDNVDYLISAKHSPREFISMQTYPCTIDEIQRAPELILPIKESVDKNRIAGQFLLTGSANLLSMPNIADSLAGRMIVLNLYPLSAQEILGRKNNWIDHIFDSKINEIFAEKNLIEFKDLCYFITRGGYPVIWKNLTSQQSQMWFQSYIQTMIERDLRDIAKFSDVVRVNRLFKDVALRSAEVLNIMDLSRSCQIPASSVTSYLAALESIFLISRAPAWFTNLHNRLNKASKLYMNDSGLLCSILNINEHTENLTSRQEWGKIVETFIHQELQKQLSWSQKSIKLLHYRTYDGSKIDFILESSNMDVVAIEVKSSKNFSSNFSKNIRRFQEENKDKFKAGIILYMGDQFLPLGDNIYAVPMSYVI